MMPECLSYFFGVCVESEAQAREIILAWGIGGLIGLAMFAGAFSYPLLYWWRRNRAMDTIDAVLNGRPTRSKRYFEIKSPFW